MRIKVNFTANTEMVPINNHHILNSYIHKCLGENNEYHDSKSEYCVSHICGGKKIKGEDFVNFPNGSFIIITAKDSDFLNKILIGIIGNSDLGYGMKFSTIDHVEETFYNGWNHFGVLSPFIISNRKEDGKDWFLTLKDENFVKGVEEHMKRKLKAIDPSLDLEGFELKINDHPSHKVKSIKVKSRHNFANVCRFSVKTNKKVAEALYNYGVGKSTGSGFGTIYKTENAKKVYAW